MNWNKHSANSGRHAFLSPSKVHWMNYSDEKIKDVYLNYLAVEEGTALHELAAKCIEHGAKLSRSHKTLNMFVNDSIGFKMKSEQPLYYSENCFGTADAISFRDNKLRIHDLKTGKSPTHMEQLIGYAALFCLEYGFRPGDIEIELRIYQNDEIRIMTPTAEDILPVMDKIIKFDKIIEGLKVK